MSNEVYKPSEEELALLKRWYAPDVGDEIDDKRTNAFGMNVSTLKQPKVDPSLVVDDSESNVLSAEALAELTQQAQDQGYQDGLTKGKEEGLLKGHDAGYEQGLEQGIEKGIAQGLAQIEPEISQRMKVLEALIASFNEPLSQQQENIEQSLLNLSLTLARKVIHCEVTQNSQPIIQAISEGVRIIGHQKPVLVRVNPDDIEAVEHLYNDEKRTQANLVLESDPSLLVGDCVLETSSSSVTLNIEEKINQVFDDFLSQPVPSKDVTENEGQVSANLTQSVEDNLVSQEPDISNTDTQLDELDDA